MPPMKRDPTVNVSVVLLLCAIVVKKGEKLAAQSGGSPSTISEIMLLIGVLAVCRLAFLWLHTLCHSWTHSSPINRFLFLLAHLNLGPVFSLGYYWILRSEDSTKHLTSRRNGRAAHARSSQTH